MHMLLMKEITDKYFKWNLDDDIDDRSYSTTITPEADSEQGC